MSSSMTPYEEDEDIADKFDEDEQIADRFDEDEEADIFDQDCLPDYIIDKLPDDLIAGMHLERDDFRNLTAKQRLEKTMSAALASLEEDFTDAYDDFDDLDLSTISHNGPLPDGYVWRSFSGEDGYKDYVDMIRCRICGVEKQHTSDKCPTLKPNPSIGVCDDKLKDLSI